MSHADYHATYPQNVLQTMDTQFSKWSYDLNEGRTSIPFVMARAPSETHERLVGIDRKFWNTGAEDAAEDFVASQATAEMLQGRAQQKAPKRVSSSKIPKLARHSRLSQGDGSLKDDSSSKNAALIAKRKVVKDSSLVASKSVGQRRAALQKNKNRKSIMPSPPPTSRKLELLPKSKRQVEPLKQTVLDLNMKEVDQRREVDAALQDGRIDIEDHHQVVRLMQQLGRTETEANSKQVIE